MLDMHFESKLEEITVELLLKLHNIFKVIKSSEKKLVN